MMIIILLLTAKIFSRSHRRPGPRSLEAGDGNGLIDKMHCRTDCNGVTLLLQDGPVKETDTDALADLMETDNEEKEKLEKEMAREAENRKVDTVERQNRTVIVDVDDMVKEAPAAVKPTQGHEAEESGLLPTSTLAQSRGTSLSASPLPARSTTSAALVASTAAAISPTEPVVDGGFPVSPWLVFSMVFGRVAVVGALEFLLVYFVADSIFKGPDAPLIKLVLYIQSFTPTGSMAVVACQHVGNRTAAEAVAVTMVFQFLVVAVAQIFTMAVAISLCYPDGA